MPIGVYPHRIKHGHSFSPTYRSWRMMVSRCKYPTHNSYKNYGGRGIVVCVRWQSFENFLADMGERPSIHHQIDRIDTDGHYEPGNCRWATVREQHRNMKRNRLITIGGRTLCATDWAQANGIKPATVLSRIGLGWDPALAVTERPRNGRALYRKGVRII
jgi:hypothetical protein